MGVGWEGNLIFNYLYKGVYAALTVLSLDKTNIIIYSSETIIFELGSSMLAVSYQI